MQNYRIETVLIIISLGALLFVLGSAFQAIAPAAEPQQTLPASTLVTGTLAQTLPLQAAGPTGTPVRPANCVPVQPTVVYGPGTPTATPYAITHRYDLAPNLEQGQKSMVLVLRCDGTWDQYWLAPAQVFDPQKELKPGDVVFSVNPPSGAEGTQAPAASQAPATTRSATVPVSGSPSPTARTASPSPTARTVTTAGTPTRTRTLVSTQAGYPAQTNQATNTPYP